ncbi:hypothetical protein EH221_07240 [bacterium]|nr:MAG: hypothetical protein EH221_07240 [bacterium]
MEKEKRIFILIAITLVFSACTSEPSELMIQTAIAETETAKTSILNPAKQEIAQDDLMTSTCEENRGKIIFSSDMNKFTDGPPFEIYMMNPDGSDIVPITRNKYYDGDPAWSPNYCQILFSSDREPNTMEDLYIMNADGSEATSITSDPGNEFEADWSPDGKRIVYVYRYMDGEELIADLMVINVDGSGKTNLTEDWNPKQRKVYDPEWSPDGSRIVFACPDSDGENMGLCMIDPDGLNFYRLKPEDNRGLFPTWSPDGTKIAFTSNLDGQNNIYIMKIDGSDLRQVTFIGSGGDPFSDQDGLKWSSDGNMIVFERAHYKEDICILHLDDLRLENLTNSDARDEDPDW